MVTALALDPATIWEVLSGQLEPCNNIDGPLQQYGWSANNIDGHSSACNTLRLWEVCNSHS